MPQTILRDSGRASTGESSLAGQPAAAAESTAPDAPHAAAGSALEPSRQPASRYRDVRQLTEALCEPLEPEDYVVQSMPDASPTKWHLAHTSWFFETFVLTPSLPGYRPFNPQYGFLFNSYYNAVGDRLARPRRGILSRPPIAEIFAYRRHVDEHIARFLDRTNEADLQAVLPVLELGLHHEQQHQELLLTDIKHAFGCNPLRPAYRAAAPADAGSPPPWRWLDFSAGLQWIGHDSADFAYDNEGPRHQQYVGAFRLASRLVTNAEYLAFIDDGGYQRPDLWLSDGWDSRGGQCWTAPLYWEQTADGSGWQTFTLAGLRPLDPAEPVCHVSFYEADAFARWAGARLPTEAEWETAARDVPTTGNLLETGALHPRPAPAPAAAGTGEKAVQLYGDVWEWTRSPYVAYPGYQPTAGALGEYNAKFMCNQLVLRGGSCVTPPGHIRPTYRNFFQPAARWQFTGIRLAQDS